MEAQALPLILVVLAVAETSAVQVEQEPLVKEMLGVQDKTKTPQVVVGRGPLVMAVQTQALAAEAARGCPRRLQEPLLLGAVAAVAVVILIWVIQTEEPVAQEEAAQAGICGRTCLGAMAQQTLVVVAAVAGLTT